MERTPGGQGDDVFAELLTELSDGQRWKLTRASGWDDFIERISNVIPDLPPRRRQALVMVLFALTEGLLDPAELQARLEQNGAGDDRGLEDLIGWLRQFRPR